MSYSNILTIRFTANPDQPYHLDLTSTTSASGAVALFARGSFTLPRAPATWARA